MKYGTSVLVMTNVYYQSRSIPHSKHALMLGQFWNCEFLITFDDFQSKELNETIVLVEELATKQKGDCYTLHCSYNTLKINNSGYKKRCVCVLCENLIDIKINYNENLS